MRKILMTLAAGLCCWLTSAVAMAQHTEEGILKQAEERIKLADKNPSNGKLQCKAGEALLWNGLGDKIDPDRALIYANRALKIAEEQVVMQDTLKGLAYLLLGDIYFYKGEANKAFECVEKGLEAISQELGRYDRWTIFQKIFLGYKVMMLLDTRRGSLMIQQAFLDSEMIPKEKRIQNLEEITALYEMALEYSMADLANKMKRGVPIVVFEGRRYIVLETADWNLEKPLVGWMMPTLMDQLQGEEEETDDEEEYEDIILCDFDDIRLPLRVIKSNEKNRPKFEINFTINPSDTSHLNLPENNSRLLFLNEESYNKALEKYHAFKAEMKKE